MKNKRKFIALCAVITVLVFNGCTQKDGMKTATPTDKVTGGVTPGETSGAFPTPALSGPVLTLPDDFHPETLFLEAEEAILVGGTKVSESGSGFSGTGYVEGFTMENDAVKFELEIKQAGAYDLNFKTMSIGGVKTNTVRVDGQSVGEITVNDTKEFADCYCKRVYLSEGTHTVEFVKSWGWVKLDSLTVTASEQLGEDFFRVDTVLCNKNASQNTKNLFAYLTSIYGKQILSGQNADSMYAPEINAIRMATGGITDGKFPAVLGLDLMEYSPSRVENGSQGKSVESAIAFFEKGGIVTFCWHWNAPSKYLTGKWYSGFYNENTNIDLGKIMNGEDPEGYELLLKDIDAIAIQLGRLQAAGVPVLWRPLHEASGGWFWWGASGPEAYKKLYILLYDKLTNEYGLDNLIWMWNGQAADWYPGDEYVDIVSTDIYPGERIYSSQINVFLETRSSANGRKMVYLSENGCIFDPELAVRDGAMWGMWCTWCGDYVIAKQAPNKLSEQYTETYMLQKAYASEYVITLDELPKIYE